MWITSALHRQNLSETWKQLDDITSFLNKTKKIQNTSGRLPAGNPVCLKLLLSLMNVIL